MPGLPGGLPASVPTAGRGSCLGRRRFLVPPAHAGGGLGPARLSEWPAGPSVTLKDARQCFLPQLPTTAYITNT